MNTIEIFMSLPEDASLEELSAFLDNACGGNAELRAQVEALIAKDQEGNAFMDRPALEGEAASQPIMEDAGTMIGNYKLLQKIGEGGFGTVYMADQLAPVKRRVALKIIKLGMDTKQVVARFEVERQALAMMDHPNIAKVHDAGATETGRPYFVMELVGGIPITKFCEEQKLDTSARLALFIDVCSAIQHAHQKGVIHRDLKPSNVIVTLHDDKSVPKVIDFGVAKATQQDLTDKTLFTQFEQFIGTPAYMSPEQAQMSGLDIDTRSDIYALGVLLYELLTGTTPFDAKTLAKAGQDEIRRVIREEEPPRPSTRLTKMQRRTAASHPDIRTPHFQIDQDLDWIVMKALEKDRTRRYETANGLAADVQRYLNDEPVTAGAPDAGYRLKKYVKRHRSMVTTVACSAAILLLATIVSTGLFLSERQARGIAVLSQSEASAARQGADRERVAAEIRLADEHLTSGNGTMGLAMLTRLLREEGDNPVAGERMMSALRLGEFPVVPLVEVPHIFHPDLRADGRKVIGVDPKQEKAFRVFDVASGKPEGVPLPYTHPHGIFGAFRPHHPSQVLVTSHRTTPSLGHAQIWNWETGDRIGNQMDIGGRLWVSSFSSDGQLVLLGGSKGGAQIFDADSGTPVGDRLKQGQWIACGEFCPKPDANGDRWATVAGSGHETLVWNVDAAERGHPVSYRLPYTEQITALRFNNEGNRVAVGAADGSVRVWNFSSGNVLTLSHVEKVMGVEFSPDDELVLSASLDGTARLWDAETGSLLMTIAHDHLLGGARFSPTGQQFLTSCYDGKVRVWETASGRQVGPGYPHPTTPQARFSPDGKHIISAGSTGEKNGAPPTRVWEVGSEPLRCQILRHRFASNATSSGSRVRSAGFSPDGKRLVTTGDDDVVRTWDVRSGSPVSDWYWFGSDDASFSPDGTLVASVGSSGAQLRDAVTGDLVRNLYDQRQYVTMGRFSPERIGGDYHFVTASPSARCVVVWNVGTGEEVLKIGSDDEHFLFVDYSPDGRLLVTGADSGSACLWDAQSGEPIHFLPHDDAVTSVVFSPTGAYVLTTSVDKTARLWDVTTGQPLCDPLLHSGRVLQGVFSPDGTMVVTCSEAGAARLWDVPTGIPVGRAIQHDRAINRVAFSPDGKRLATASSDKTARLWDVATGLPLTEALRHDGGVGVVVFSPGGEKLVTCGDDGKAQLWEVPAFPKTAIPNWVLDWADAVTGVRLAANGTTIGVPLKERQQIVRDVAARTGGDYFDRVAAWFYKDRSERTIDAFSDMTRDQWVRNRIRENTIDSLEEAAHAEPENLEALLAMSELLTSTTNNPPANKRRAKIYASQATRVSAQDTTRGEASVERRSR